MKKPIFTGANVAIVTPMTETGVNYPEFRRFIDDQIARGIDSITICGTTGEGSTLTDQGAQGSPSVLYRPCQWPRSGYRRYRFQ